MVIYSQAVSHRRIGYDYVRYPLIDVMQELRCSRLVCFKCISQKSVVLSWISNKLTAGAFTGLDLSHDSRYLAFSFLRDPGPRPTGAESPASLFVADLWMQKLFRIESGEDYGACRWLGNTDKLLIERLNGDSRDRQPKAIVAMAPNWQMQKATWASVQNADSVFGIAKKPANGVVRRLNILSPGGRMVLANIIDLGGNAPRGPIGGIGLWQRSGSKLIFKKDVGGWTQSDGSRPSDIGLGWITPSAVLCAELGESGSGTTFKLWRISTDGLSKLSYTLRPVVNGDDILGITMNG